MVPRHILKGEKMEHINSEVMATKTINNVTITLTREWSIFNDKKDCVYYLTDSSQSFRSLMYYESEAVNQFHQAVSDLETTGKVISTNLEKLLGLGYTLEAAKELDAQGVTASQVQEEDYNDFMSTFYPECKY